MRTTGLALALVAGLVAPTYAATFSTAHVSAGSGELLECTVTNVGTTPVTVTVTWNDFNGSPIVPNAESCSFWSGAPGSSCVVGLGLGGDGSCIIDSSSSKVRAMVAIYNNSGGVDAVIPATKK